MKDFNELPEKEWDGECMIMLWDGDKYFPDPQSALEYCAEEDVKPELIITSNDFRFNEVNVVDINDEYCTEYEGNMFASHFPEIMKKEQELNEMLRNAKGKLWWGIDVRLKLSDYDIKYYQEYKERLTNKTK